MSAEGHDNRTLLIAFAANLGIAVSKFAAAAFTGSSAMLTEGIHSVVDSLNQLLLIWGRRQSRRAPTEDHPFGPAANSISGASSSPSWCSRWARAFRSTKA